MLLKDNNCKHCNLKLINDQKDFCCLGCQKAYQIIDSMGLKNYYQIREINFSEANLKPQIDNNFDITEFAKKNEIDNLKINSEKKSQNNNIGSWHLDLVIQGLQCGACVWLIENLLKKNPKVLQARINLTRKILSLDYFGEIIDANEIISRISEVGYKFLPFDQEVIQEEEKKYNNSLIKALGVAGFGAGNIMLFSFALWFNNSEEMGFSTHQFFQLISAIIALPVIIYSARIFFISAFQSLKNGYANMDVPISLAIILAGIVSIFQTYRGGDHVYFDSAVMLIFFLLIGRFLEMKARKKAFNIATEFSLLNASFARVEEDGKVRILPIKKLQKNMILIIASGEKIPSDAIVIEGESEVDDSLISGEIIYKNEIINGK
jgi:Cu2+-exporting ATPase